MQVRVITPPQRPLTLDEVKLHLRVEHDDEDTLIEALIDAATGHLGGPGGWLGLAIGAQTLEATDWSFGCLSTHTPLLLPYAPISAPISVKYLDGAGAEQTLDGASYDLYLDEGLILASGVSLPALAWRGDALRIRYAAGATISSELRLAMLLLIGHWYETREAVNIGNSVNALPFSVEALLSPLRRYP
jgi:uncharacterized phiE125 gp8 family phage protein